MDFRRITAIIQPEALEKVEQKLQELDVPGVSVTKIKGYGEYKDFYTHDWMMSHVKVEVFIEAARAESVAVAIMETAHTGIAGDGMVAIMPVESLYHIRTKQKCDSKPY